MNRRLTSNANDEESTGTPEARPDPPARSRTAPPKYINYTPGGRLEFLKDLEAYQTACLIKKVVDIPDADPSPAYALDDINTVPAPEVTDDKEVFKIRLLHHLSRMKEYLQARRKGTVTNIAITEKSRLIISAVLLILIAGATVTWVLALKRYDSVIFVLIGLWAIIVLQALWTGHKYWQKRRMLSLINSVSVKVSAFEKLNDKTVQALKRGTDRGIPKAYWRDVHNLSSSQDRRRF
ncbi:hypothetical protein H072_3263 [Dactylellina haptotyla CBS 200.50]|uniref:Uncharacterized protein n=1 Tax=Dactylellina haptotyla (strain CBS 200.50) TaxID=1284197 RepID=S8BTC1_DACHA|nr:hypothetical protein H072_3263 [Dactylellina haptotyla CBS 200.50]